MMLNTTTLKTTIVIQVLLELLEPAEGDPGKAEVIATEGYFRTVRGLLLIPKPDDLLSIAIGHDISTFKVNNVTSAITFVDSIIHIDLRCPDYVMSREVFDFLTENFEKAAGAWAKGYSYDAKDFASQFREL